MSLSKEQILGAKDLVGEPIMIPEWGGEVYVGIMSGHELNRFQKWMRELEGEGVSENAATKITRLAALLVCDEDGSRLFKESDVEALLDKSAVAMRRVMEKALKVNRLTEEEASELVGESASGQS